VKAEPTKTCSITEMYDYVQVKLPLSTLGWTN